MKNEDTVEIICQKIGSETAKAIKVTLLDDREVWFAFSCVHEIHRDDEPPRIVVDRWVAEKEDAA